MRLKLNFKINRKFFYIWLGLFCLVALSLAVRWTTKQFGRINLDEIALVMHVGLGGMDSGLLGSFIHKVVVRGAFISLGLSILCQLFAQYKFVTKICFAIVGLAIVFRLCTGNVQLGSFFYTTTSNFYETEYVDPETTIVRFPKKRRNVLLIVLESIEKSYANADVFPNGVLTPRITNLENNHISFHRYEVLSGLTHTIAAITGMTTGLPLFFTGYKQVEKMVGAHGIGNVLKKHGYQTWAMFPASGDFSLKANFLRRIGFDNVYDGVYFKSLLTRPLDVSPFDGVDDASLFTMARPMISDIISADKPYFILMETVNTHCEGYFTQACRDMGFPQQEMSDIFKCEDAIISDFVKWFRKQDPDAVVVLINDHTLHSGDEILQAIEDIEVRALANVFINTNVFYGADMNRPVAAFDFFPTIIEAAGGEITGCRLGLGTSLTARCGDVPTLREKYGDQDLELLMEQRNDLYYQLATGKRQKNETDNQGM